MSVLDTPTPSLAGPLLEQLAAIVSPDGLITGDEVAFFATDVFRALAMPLAVVRPASVEQLRAAVVAATRLGVAVVTRGGGASYTDAYLPTVARSILLDTGGLNRIVEINARDMTVTVEPGVTWAALSDALAGQGLRTQFRGPFSGLVATVGGAISQGANGHGSNTFGVSAESVLGFDVVTASGEILRTGQSAPGAAGPFFRYYGPDLTGLFTADCGALGVKVAITLRLTRVRPVFDCISFAVPDFPALRNLMSEAAAHRLDEKSFGLDLALSQGQIGRQDAGSAMKIAASVISNANGLISGLTSLARIGLAGTGVLRGSPYAAHYIVEGVSRGETRAKIALLRQIGLRFASEIPNSVPTIVHGMPFAPLHNALGPKGERWVPLHGIFAHSNVLAFHEALTQYLAARAEEMKQRMVHAGAMFSAIGPTALLYEPALYWEDEQSVFHHRMMDRDYLEQLPKYTPNPGGAALVTELRSDMADLMHRFGAAHFQIGKFYPYLDDLNGPSIALLRAIKNELDPDNLMNPGALGL